MAHAARCDMACVCDVNSFGGGPSWDPGLCRSLPLQKRDSVVESESVGRAESFSSAGDANEKGGNLLYIVHSTL